MRNRAILASSAMSTRINCYKFFFLSFFLSHSCFHSLSCDHVSKLFAPYVRGEVSRKRSRRRAGSAGRPGHARYFVMPLITTVSLLGNRLSQLIYVTSVPNGEGDCKSMRKLILMYGERRANARRNPRGPTNRTLSFSLLFFLSLCLSPSFSPARVDRYFSGSKADVNG